MDPRNHVLAGDLDPPGKGAVLGASSSPLPSIGYIQPKLFDRWQQRSKPSLSVLQQLVNFRIAVDCIHCYTTALGGHFGIARSVRLSHATAA